MNPLLRGVTNRKDDRRHSMDYDGGNKATMMEDMQNIRTPKNISHDVDRHNNKQLKESQATYWRHCELIRIKHG